MRTSCAGWAVPTEGSLARWQGFDSPTAEAVGHPVCGTGFQPVMWCGTGFQPVMWCGTGFQPVSRVASRIRLPPPLRFDELTARKRWGTRSIDRSTLGAILSDARKGPTRPL